VLQCYVVGILQDWATPQLCSTYDKGDKTNTETAMSSYLDCLGRPCLDKGVDKLREMFEKFPEDSLCLLRLKDNSDGIVKDQTWIPTELQHKGAKIHPEELGTFGGPWLLASRTFASRKDMTGQPFVAQQHMLINHIGSHIVFLFPMEAVCRLVFDVSEGLSFLGKMEKKDALKWCANNITIANLTVEEAYLWVPMGVMWVMVGHKHEFNFAVIQPLFHTEMAKATLQRPLLAMAKMHYEFFSSMMLKGPYKNIVAPYKAWLNNIVPEKTVQEKKSKKDKKEKKEKGKDKEKDNGKGGDGDVASVRSTKAGSKAGSSK
jgi:hypothetical protein